MHGETIKFDFKDFNILILIILLIIYVEPLSHKLTHKLHTSKKFELPKMAKS